MKNKHIFWIFITIFIWLWVGCDQTIIIHRKNKEGVALITPETTNVVTEESSVQTDISNPEEEQGKIITEDIKTENIKNESENKENIEEEGEGNVEGGSVVTDIQMEDIQERRLLFQIIADYPEGEITPDKILVDNKETKPGDYFSTGTHTYIIEKKGYKTLKGNFEIPEGVGDFTLIRRMIALPREIRFNIIDKVTTEKIIPDKVVLNGREIREGAKIKPGSYILEINKKGYQSIVDNNYIIEVGEGPFYIHKELVPAKVQLKFQFSDAETGKKIKPDKIYLNKTQTSDNSYAEPGTYILSVFKRGYKPYKKKVTIPNQPLYVIKGVLEKSVIIFDWKITGDYPKGEEVVPESVIVDGRNVEQGDYISPGPHQVIVKLPGYETYRKNIIVPDDINRYVFKAELTSIPRLIELAINYDVPPSIAQSKKLGMYEVYFTNLLTDETFKVKSGDRVKPGAYEILIKRKAYEPLKRKIRIFPKDKPYKIEATLIAKYRIVKVEVTYDIEPPKNLAPYVVEFIDLETNIARTVKPGGTIKPGRYKYRVVKPGYIMKGNFKKIIIEPDESPFFIKADLKAQSRKIVFDIVYNKVMITPTKLLINGEKYNFDKKYKPGKYHIYMTFKKFNTIEEDINILPGVGPYIVKFKLIPKK